MKGFVCREQNVSREGALNREWNKNKNKRRRTVWNRNTIYNYIASPMQCYSQFLYFFSYSLSFYCNLLETALMSFLLISFEVLTSFVSFPICSLGHCSPVCSKSNNPVMQGKKWEEGVCDVIVGSKFVLLTHPDSLFTYWE